MAAGSLMKINLGAGAKHLPGFVNCDMTNNWCSKAPDVACDVFGRLPFPDACADEVHAYHVAEHTHRWLIEGVLAEWARVLKPGGLMVLELPCLDKILDIFNQAVERGIAPPTHLTMWGLFGDPKWKSEAMCHRWCYSIAEMSHLMTQAGLTVEAMEAKTHQPIRDMRLEGRKCGSILAG